MNTIFKLLCACLLVLAVSAPSQATLVEFNGAIDLTFINWGKDGQSGGDSFFDVYEVYLLGRVDISEDVSGYFELRCEHSGEAILRQGYIKWNLSDPLAFTMGYFYTPIGQYWVKYYVSTRKFATYSYPMRMINVTPWGEAGVMMSGRIPVSNATLNYALAVINGLDEDYIGNIKPRSARQNRDNNWNKMVVGRIGFSPIRELEVGVSYAGGKYDDNTTKTLQFINADASLEVGDLSIRGEWVQSEAEDLTTTDKIKSSGFYTHAAYKIIKDKNHLHYIEPAVRYELLDPGREMKDRFTIGPETTGVISAISFCLNVSPHEHFLLKAEYRMTTEEKDPQLDNNSFYFQGCVDF